MNSFSMSMIKVNRLGGAAAALSLVVFTATVARAEPTPEELEFFETKVRPVLVENCYKCHSSSSEKVKGGLLLDSKEALMKGGSSGAVLIPGNAEKSAFIKRLRMGVENDEVMPPAGQQTRPTPQQIADLEAWVKMGAPDPRTGRQAGLLKTAADKDKAKTHWAFQPVKKPVPPAAQNVKLAKWVQSPVDSFIAAKLAEKGMLPSFPTDRWTLIRRAYFDLIGLPPSPDEVAAFVNDPSPDAFARVVDRLLASPQYGERWARYWLDIARYADTRGGVNNNRMTENRYIYSYTYRDYVINSFNEDLPYDQFIIQQVAADQLSLTDNKKALAAMGLLTLGRQGQNQQEVIDDRIDVLMRGTMGLSVYCARCHDHKFDPIPTKDYYSLYGVFASSVEPQEKPTIETTEQKTDYEDYLKKLAALEAQLELFRENTITKFLNEARANTPNYLAALHTLEVSKKTLRDRTDQDEFEKSTKLSPFMAQVWQGYLRNRAHNKNDRVWGAWASFAELPENDFALKAKDLAAKYALNDKAGKAAINPLVAKAFSTPPPTMRAVADRYGKLLTDAASKWENTLTLYGKQKAAAKEEDLKKPAALPDAAQEELRKVLYASELNVPYDRLAGINNQRILRQEDPIKDKIVTLNITHPGAPRKAMALTDLPTPRNAKVMIKGSPNNLGPEVPRQFLEIVAGPNRQPFQKGSGRLELAQAIASKDNPLTARVMANRVWMNHFGTGIVRTASDFGLRSEDPTHPELLDYLASYFMENGWSIKKLHRLIMLSSTYQQGSEENPRYALIDPSNLYLYKMNRRRLDFEAFRDSLLTVSGKIDLKMGGQPEDLTREPFSTRRTIYGFIDRRNLAGMFRTFDFANPDATVGQRFNSTVPQQALFMMNSPFVVDLARTYVQRTDFKNTSLTDEQRIESLYWLAYQRPPLPAEVKLGKYFLDAQAGAEPVKTEQPVWKYGYGEYDEKARKVKSFFAFPRFNGKAYQGDARFGQLTLTAVGGHPGGNHQLTAIRRWTAPRDGAVSITATLGHDAKDGDGVQAYVCSSRTGELGRWTAQGRKVDTKVDKVEVKKGDTLDFIVDCRTNAKNDQFTWTPVIKMLGAKPGSMAAAGAGMMSSDAPVASEWNARTDFIPAVSNAPKPLNAWEKYAQVLLLSNELSFVD